MARYALVYDVAGIVVNVIELSGDLADWQPPAGYTAVPDDPPQTSPGWSWDGTEFQPPPRGPVEPQGPEHAVLQSAFSICVNVIWCPDDWQLPAGYEMRPNLPPAAVGWMWDGTSYVPPPGLYP